MSKEYKIMHIGDGEDSRYGAILIVKANPIMNNGYSKSYISYLYSETETFFFPLKKNIIDKLVNIANGEELWIPDVADFKIEYIRDDETNERKKVYRHVSFWGQHCDISINSANTSNIIPDKYNKINTLYNQYFRNGWFESYSFSDYVVSLAENDAETNFWQWLFNTSKLRGYEPIDLPHEYYIRYREFIEGCIEKEYDNL